MSQPVSWSFGPFQFDPSSGRLTKFGHRVKLQPKAASLLGCLLESRGELVTRAQLHKALWPEGTYVDFDLGIKSVVKKLRDALGDTAAEPIYVRTVYAEGFRFIAPALKEDPAAGPAESLPLPVAASVDRGAGRPQWWTVAMAVCVAAVSGAMVSSRAPGAAAVFQNRDWVLIAAFENRTGEAVLDGTMEFALASELARSAYINVAPPDRIADSLRLMRQKPDATLTEELARQVAIRDGAIRAVLAGRVERFGPQYILTIRLVKPAGGDTLAIFRKPASREQLPDTVRHAAEVLRQELGESGVQTSNPPPIERATTPSLPALRAFSTGMQYVNQRKWHPAVELLEEAVKEDPDFALAHIYAAHLYSNLGENDRAAAHYESAYRLAPGVTVRERLFVLASYFDRYALNLNRAREEYEALTNLYPDDYWGVHNLSDVYRRLGMEREEMAMRERLIALRPMDRTSFAALIAIWRYYKRHDPEKATHVKDELRRRRPELPAPMAAGIDARLDTEAAADRWAKGDVDGAARELAGISAHTTAQRHWYLFHIAQANQVIGRVHAAKALCQSVPEANLRTDCLLYLAMAAEDRDLARKQLPLLNEDEVSYEDVAAAAWLGETDLARHWAQIAGNRTNPPMLGGMRGIALLAQGRTEEAVNMFHGMSWATGWGANWEYLWWRTVYSQALQRLGRLQEAASQLGEETRPPNVDFVWAATWPKPRLELAKLLRKTGRTSDAMRVEEEIRHYLSQADGDYWALAQLRTLDAGVASK